MRIFFRCLDCGQRIPRRGKTLLGMRYKPLSCNVCVARRNLVSSSELWAANLGLREAEAKDPDWRGLT